MLSGTINTMADLDVDPSFNSRGVFAEGDHPAAGNLRYPGRPFIMNESPWQLRRTAPLLGQHTGEVLRELGYSEEAIEDLSVSKIVLLAQTEAS